MTSRRVTLDAAADEPLLFEIPRQEFEEHGKRHVMSSQVLQLQGVWRYDLDGKIVAYSIGLTPRRLPARENAKWKVDGEVDCIFSRAHLSTITETATFDCLPRAG